MSPLLFVILLTAVFIAVVYAIARGVAQVRALHELRLALIEELAGGRRKPESPEDVEDWVTGAAHKVDRRTRQDLRLTGGLLAGFGGVCIVAGRLIRIGRVAVALYYGGIGTVSVGFLTLLVGLYLWHATKPPRSNRKPEDGP